jgi:AAA-like domain
VKPLTTNGQLQVGGTLNPQQHLYIERKEDAELLDLLARGEYCNILSSRQVGKSSLIMHALLALRQRGVRVCLIDVAGVLGSPASADEWYAGLLSEIVRQQGIRTDVRAWWTAAQGTPNQKLLEFFRDVLLASFEQPLAVFLDEIDHTLKFDYTDDFFTAIRAMYNDRAREPAFTRLTFCLAGVATPNELVKNRRTTAYNVGRTLELSDFSFERNDLTPIVRAVSPNPEEGETIVRAVLNWTGGHPFLTLRFCEQFLQAGGTTAADVDRIVQDTYTDLEHLKTDVHFDQISRFLQERLADGPATLELYQRILSGAREPDRPTVYHAQLKLSGLVKRDESGNLVVRNRLYAKIFDRRWVQESLPRATTARYRQLAFLAAGVLLVGAVAAGIYQFVIVPPRAAAAQALAELAATSDEATAKARYASLTGANLPMVTRWIVRDYRAEAERAFRGFWQRRAATLEARALDRLKDGKVDEACVLGAAAAVKTGGALHPDIQKAFVERKFSALAASVIGMAEIPASTVLTEWVGVFEPSGQLIRLTQGLQYYSEAGRNELRVVDAHTGAILWKQGFGGIAIFIDDGTAALEILQKSVRVWPVVVTREANSPQQGNQPAATIAVTASLRDPISLATSVRIRRPAGATAVQAATVFVEAAARCVGQANVNTVDSLGLDRNGDLLAIVGNGAVAVCQLSTGSIAARISQSRSNGASAIIPGPVFSPDGRLLATSDGQVHNWRDGAVVASPAGRAIAFSADGSLLLVSNSDDVRGRQQAIAFSSRRNDIASSRTRVLSTRTWRPVATSAGYGVTISPDGQWLVTTNGSGASLDVSGVHDGKVYTSLSGTFAIFSEDSRWLTVSGGGRGQSDAPIRVWNAAAFGGQSPAPPAAPTPAARWGSWQTKFGLTVNENDDVVPVWRTGPRPLDGLAASDTR